MDQEQEQPSSERRKHSQVAASGDQAIGGKPMISDEGEPDNNNSAGPPLGSDTANGGLESRRFWVELVTVIVLVATLLASVIIGSFQIALTWKQATIAEKQAEISAKQAKLSDQQNSLSRWGIQSARFQSIYEKMLDVTGHSRISQPWLK
jgi:hypothetical protein